jgi:PilZ domain
VFISKPSQTAEASVEDRRRSVRHPAVNQVAKIRLPSGREELCLLRDISAEGLKAEVYIPLERGVAIDIELRTAHTVRGRVVWAANNEIGVAFDAAIPAAAMLAHCSFEANGGSLRPPRLKVNLRGLFRIGADARMVSIGNISQAGLQIEAARPLRVGTQCSIALPGLPARAAAICWWREGHAGLMLTEPFDYPDFARWRAASR